ncbi:MAG: type-F conjugative transfer system pilin assembly protein TrbC [Rhizobacter sp.]
MRLFSIATLLLALCPLAGLAQQKPAVSDKDIERTKAQIKSQMESLTDEQIEAVRRRVIVPQQKGVNDSAINAFRPVMPKLGAMPTPQTKPSVDVGALAGQFLSQMQPISPADLAPQPKLLVFVTLALPADTLTALVVQAERAQATLVLRGMVNNSLRETGAAVRKIVGKHRVGFTIDPDAFDRYGVTRAPSFVLAKASVSTKPCADKHCTAVDGFALIAGDVSLDYALERIEQRAPRFKTEAREFLKRMRG